MYENKGDLFHFYVVTAFLAVELKKDKICA